jgi:acyl-CoA synthetase (NDP forming)
VSTRIKDTQGDALSAWESRAVAQVDALLNPRNVVIVGASDRKGSWTEKVYENLRRYEFKGAVYPINPKRAEIWGVPCFADLAALPEKPDHLAILVPAAAVAGVLREGAAAGARSATIFTSGFEESDGPEGAALARELELAVRETGLAVSGPNCFGNLSSSSSLVTIPDGRAQSVASGPVAIVAQSGGIGMAIKRTLEERGARVGYVVTSGNETGLTTADYIRYFVTVPDVKAIVCYLEAVRDRDGFLAACRAARAVAKPVIVMKLGTSVQGRAAALAHTGALAGTAASFDAIAGVSGAIRVGNLDDLVEVTEYALHARLPQSRGLAAITFSGGLRGMLLDAAERNGVQFAALQDATREEMSKLLGVGAGVGNPVDGGFAAVSSQETYLKCVELMLNDPGVDLLLLQEELPRGPGAEAKESNLRKIEELATQVAKPIAYTSMISYGLNDYSRALRAELPHLPFLQEVDKSLRAVARIIHYATSDMPVIAGSASEGTREVATKLGELARGMDKASALSEPVSKEVLRAYGVPVLAEQIVRTADEAATVAEKMGFPVVLKAASADLPHKTEAGAVMLGLASRGDVKAAYGQILANVKAYNPKARVEGVIVSPQISGGLELVLGISRDPEVGAVVMFGLGGIGVDLHGDVAFSHPMLDEAEANKLIDRTKAAKLIDGYRGQRGYDRAAVARALVALGALARDLGDVIEAVDVNPFVALPEGGYALDGLVVVRPHAENSK